MSTNDSTSHGSTLGLVSWVLTVGTFFAVAIKIGTKITVKRQIDISLDSVFVLGAIIFAAGQTGALTIALQQGLGDHIDTLNASEIRKYQQATYAADILYISAVCLSKLSITTFFFYSTVGRSPRAICGVVGGLIALWWLTSILSLAFQCSLPDAWMFLQNTCIDRKAFWLYSGTVDAFTDICILLLPFYTFSFLQLPAKVKPKIIAPFCVRVLVVPATIVRLVYLVPSLNSADPTFDSYRAVLVTLIQMNLSIISACTPFSKFVMGGVQSGLLTSNLRVLAPTYAGNQGYSLNSVGRKTKSKSTLGLGLSNRTNPLRDLMASTTTQISRNSFIKEGTGRGRGSPTESEQQIIRQTTEWAVDFDSRSPVSPGKI